MINLLPSEHRLEIKKEYMVRRLIVFLSLSAAVLAAGVTLLIPTYINYHFMNREIDTELASLADRVRTSEGALIEDEVVSLNAKLVLAQPASTTPLLASDLFAEVSAALGSGVTLTSATFNRLGKDTNTPSRARISGIASDRDALLAFVRRLDAQPHIDKVDSPVSNLTKNRNLSYEVTFEVLPFTQ